MISLNFIINLIIYIIFTMIFLFLVSYTPRGLINPIIGFTIKLNKLASLFIGSEENRDIERQRKIIYYATLLGSKKVKGHYKIYDKKINLPNRSVRIRIYQPKREKSDGIIIYFHGGGYVIGSIETHDNICRAISIKTGLNMISVDYRLAPENKFPSAIEDAFDTLLWTINNINELNLYSDKIYLIGDSAGANICAVTCIKARNYGLINIKAQILIYPVTNIAELNTESYKLYDKDYLLSKRDIEWFRKNYLPSEELSTNPEVSPLFEKNLSNLPPALIILAQYDVLNDEGKMFANKLKEAGNYVELLDVKGVTHGFLSIDRFIPQTRIVYEKIKEFILKIK